MSVFAQIEAHLVEFAAEQPASLTRDRRGTSHLPWGPKGVGFEERRIDWHREGIRLAIIIQPTFTLEGVDSSKWNFRTVAWQDVAGERLVAGKVMLTEVPFQLIEAQVEELLAEARAYLNSLQRCDLKPQADVRY